MCDGGRSGVGCSPTYPVSVRGSLPQPVTEDKAKGEKTAKNTREREQPAVVGARE